MGCDIHMYMEARGGVKHFMTSPEWKMIAGEEVYDERNYTVFALLAGVRDYGEGNTGFGFNRGLPNDVSPEVMNEYEEWGPDSHTPGYATLTELKEKINSLTGIKHCGWVHKDYIKRFKETGEPPISYSRYAVHGYPDGEFEKMSWETPVGDCFKYMLDSIENAKRQELSGTEVDMDDPEVDQNIRVIFWFDN